ncbi:hypothetical protein THIOM_004468 [Candidatus Thiomargarita nelsonii]|uniref:Uncharacterized protein n=1 Tax=Candidatus Thiomargarita nelsonii TaxID=1003181 RepID=A0A176RVS4_9GAMM|nr:hypothetical protein THIOM_004468 [Candidatus Thiomargarita nelsonii]
MVNSRVAVLSAIVGILKAMVILTVQMQSPVIMTLLFSSKVLTTQYWKSRTI